MTEIGGRVAVVTGGGSGIGKALSMELARQGAAVAVVDILVERAHAVANAITAEGGKAVVPQPPGERQLLSSLAVLRLPEWRRLTAETGPLTVGRLSAT